VGAPSDRGLFLVGIGAAGLLAQFACALVAGAPERAARRWPAVALACMLMVVHLVVSPVRLAWSAARAPDTSLERIAESLLVGQPRAVIVNAPSVVIVAFSLFVRAHQGQPIPPHTRVLSSGAGPVSVTTVDARTIRVRWIGRQEALFRGEYRMTPRERVRLAGTDVEVISVTADGWPTEAVFLFDTELRDPALRWLRWESGGFVSFHPPAIGETVVLDSRLGARSASVELAQ
jgi:hypothetical protein